MISSNNAAAILALKIISLVICISMIAATIITSQAQSLFEHGGRLMREPWMVATLLDFYFNIILISVWTLYREASPVKSVIWIVLFILLGSIATSFYAFLQLNALKPGESLGGIFIRKTP